MAKKSTPTNILAAREAEAKRRAAVAAPAPPAEVVTEIPQEPGIVNTEQQETIPYTIGDVFAALGEANWNIQLLQRQNQILRQQVATYRNLVAELEAKLKVASGAPA